MDISISYSMTKSPFRMSLYINTVCKSGGMDVIIRINTLYMNVFVMKVAENYLVPLFTREVYKGLVIISNIVSSFFEMNLIFRHCWTRYIDNNSVVNPSHDVKIYDNWINILDADTLTHFASVTKSS